MVQSRVVGVLGLGDRENRVFTEEEILLGQAIADQAALALENARLYAEARESNRAKDDFLATLSHELRTPLTAMLGWIRMLRSGHLDAPTAARALEVIDRNTKLQAQLIEDLLDVSRIITGKLDLDFRSVDLVGVIEAAIDAVGQGADAKSIRLAKTFDRTAGVVSGDPARLQQVVWNLLSNAIKFTPKGGRVDVRLDRAASYVRIRVIDTGKGISAEFLPHIFGRFRQADSTTTRAHGGLGLGLAIVHHLVELHHGTVQAESAGEDEGATFTVMLPLLTLREAGDVASRRRAGGSAAMAPPRLDGARVLVVDDEADTREVLTTILGGSGAEVTSVGSTGDALDALARARPDVLVSDIAMPDEDGYALIRQVRALEADGGGRIPAVALTAHARPEDRTQVMTAGYQVHLPKPVEPSTLVEAVARLLGRR
jgi:signal transduction histidine kinase